jgi:hypothetical protein
LQSLQGCPYILMDYAPESPEGMLIGKKNVYEYPELSNAVTCMNYVNKETEIPPVLMMHGLADYECYCNGDDAGIYGSNGRNCND